MAAVVIADRARSDLAALIQTRQLPGDTRDRVRRRIQALEAFPLLGKQLSGRWAPFRLIVGPWPWLLLVYQYDAATDTVTVVAIHDARAARSATTGT
jgi:mRNA-degrading endonuclease RelE of RelBE toxin-antitoxin system